MNILYITRKHPPSIGGMQTQSHQFYHALKKQHRVYLICWRYSQKLLPLFLLWAIIKGVYYNLCLPVDVIQLGDLALAPLGLLYKRMLGKKTYAFAHGKDVSYNNPLYQRLMNYAAKRLDGIIAVSGFLRQRLLEKGLRPDAVFVNLNGIDCPDLAQLPDKITAKKQIQQIYGIDLKDKKIILSVGRLVRKKGIYNFVQNILPFVLDTYPDVFFLVAGEAQSQEARNEKHKILAFIKQSGLSNRVFFLGNIYDRKILFKSIFAAAEVLVMPNQHYAEDYEGFGLVILEASINAVPAVAFAVDGIPEALKHQSNGILLKPGDNPAFIAALSELLQDNQKTKALGEKARQFVQAHYNWPLILERYIEIIKQNHGPKT